MVANLRLRTRINMVASAKTWLPSSSIVDIDWQPEENSVNNFNLIISNPRSLVSNANFIVVLASVTEYPRFTKNATPENILGLCSERII